MFQDDKELFHIYINKGLYSNKFGLNELKILIVFFLKDIIKSMIYFLTPIKKVELNFLRSKNVLFIGSKNNYQTLKFLKNKLPHTLFVSPGGYGATISNCFNIRPFINNFTEFKKYFFIFYLMFSSNYIISNIEKILKSYGLINIYISILKNNRPNSIVISNDHDPSSRGIIIAAKKLKIPCIYIQHASVSKYFPPLRFSHALLYGQYSKDVYEKIGETNTKVYQVGMHQFDYLKQIIENKYLTQRIGLAFNTIDDIDDVSDLYKELNNVFPNVEIIIRPHPRDKRKLSDNFNISSLNKEDATAFLSKVDILIAGNSSILLEAALMNVLPLQYYFGKHSEKFGDYYGFIKTGLAIEVYSPADVIEKIDNFYSTHELNIRQKAKVYDASVNSDFEFKVEEKIVEIIINDILA